MSAVSSPVAGSARSRTRARAAGRCALVLWGVVHASNAVGQPLDANFRIFLTDGTSLVSYGEYARVGNRLVFSVPIGPSESASRLQLMTLPVTSVDLPRTEAYTDAVRYRRYAATRGEADYAQLTSDVAMALDLMTKTTDPAQRLEIAEAARRAVAAWPRAHYGYRSGDLRQIGALLDEAISELRAATGSREFTLDLVAAIEPPAVPLLPPPTPAEAIAQVLNAARHVDVTAERLSLLRVVVSLLDESAGTLPPNLARSLRRRASRALGDELRVERAYAKLVRTIVERAAAEAGTGDVTGVLRLVGDLAREDARLGHKRPEEMTAVMAALDTHLETARRVRLARDQWLERTAAAGPYRSRVTPIVRDLGRAGRHLEAIKSLAGPDTRTLQRLATQLAAATSRLAALAPTDAVAPIHALIVSAAELARQAVAIRQAAVRANDVATAWNASSAAAGSLMLLARARADLEQFFEPPGAR